MNPTELSPGQVVEEVPAPQPTGWEENLNDKIMCQDCQEDPPNVEEDFTTGDTVCLSCGLVLGQRLTDMRSEWRTFANDENGGDDPSRVGKADNPLDSGHQLETAISFGDGSQRAKEIARAHSKMNEEKGKKSLANVFQEIGTDAGTMHLPDVAADYAKLLYKMTHDQQGFRGKNLDALKAGCIFIACRQLRMPRTFKEINGATSVSKKDIGRTFKALETFLKKNKEKEQQLRGGESSLFKLSPISSASSSCPSPLITPPPTPSPLQKSDPAETPS